MIKRISLLITAAITLLMMTAGPAFANHGGPHGGGPGGGDFKSFCDERQGTFSEGTQPGANDDTCTTRSSSTSTEPYENRTRDAGKSGRGFDQTGTQDVTTTTTTVYNKKNDPDPEKSESIVKADPVITGCKNPGGKNVKLDNPNC